MKKIDEDLAIIMLYIILLGSVFIYYLIVKNWSSAALSILLLSTILELRKTHRRHMSFLKHINEHLDRIEGISSNVQPNDTESNSSI